MFTKELIKKFVVYFVLLVFALVFIVLFYKNNLVLTVLLLILGLISLKFSHKHNIYFFIVSAIIGAGGEIIAIHFGVWKYYNPTFLEIPIWLPLAWGLIVILIKTLSEIFIKIKFD